ncbi:MAG: DinB family protein [Actinomycetota bacterium]
MTNPLIAAARHLFDDSAAEMRAAVEGASPDALNWRPAGEETNSMAVLAVHSLHSTRWWLSVAVGRAEPERDRDSEFVASADDAASLVAFCDSMAADCRALLSIEEPVDWSATRTTSREHGDPDPLTAAWALLHALEHLREHVAHLQLTRQLWDADQSGAPTGRE